jgi:hypothetical protein
VDLEVSASTFSDKIERPRNSSWFWQILVLFVKGMDVIWHLLLSKYEIVLCINNGACMTPKNEV